MSRLGSPRRRIIEGAELCDVRDAFRGLVDVDAYSRADTCCDPVQEEGA